MQMLQEDDDERKGISNANYNLSKHMGLLWLWTTYYGC